MMRNVRTSNNNTNGHSFIMSGGSDGCRAKPGSKDWEMRPGGMLVQMRTVGSDRNSVLVSTIRVRVKYGSIYHEVNISSQATFGELKKMLSGLTAIHHEDQKLFYKDKERDSKAFLDIVGVKDKSKILLVEDPLSKEKRLLERRKNAKMEKAAKSISQISLEVDRLSGRVSAFESIISKGGKVVETDVLNLIELLMNQLLKLDGIVVADEDVKLQRKMQVKRVQKYVETLDLLKVKNYMPRSNEGHTLVQPQQKHPNEKRLGPVQEQQQKHSNGHDNRLGLALSQEKQQEQPRNSHENSVSLYQEEQPQPSKNSTSGVVVTTNWEVFDSIPPLIPVQSTPPPPSVINNLGPPKFNWEFFN